MVKGPVKANDIQVQIILSNISVLEDAVNQWLSNAPGDIMVHDIVYQYFGGASSDAGKASVLIVFGKKGKQK